MIKVTDNGVPLAAIASVEFTEPRTYCNRYVVNFPGHRMLMPMLKLPMTEAEARRLRDEWLKTWPEVADYLSQK